MIKRKNLKKWYKKDILIKRKININISWTLRHVAPFYLKSYINFYTTLINKVCEDQLLNFKIKTIVGDIYDNCDSPTSCHNM